MNWPKKRRKPSKRVDGKWVFVPHEELTPAQREEMDREEKDEVWNMCVGLGGKEHPFSAMTEFHDYYPGANKVPDEGAWVLVKDPPNTEYTVPPFSIWFATPWQMEIGRRQPNRIKIVTPRGNLGLFPHEYVIADNPGKFFEHLNDGITAKFFGSEEGVPRDKLFYLRSRGISKSDAMLMLVGSINAHGVMWLETDREYAQVFYRGEWPHPSRLATVFPDAPKPQNAILTPQVA